MATKKKPTPKPIECRGLTLGYDKRNDRYTTKDGKVFAFKVHWADSSWVAGVIVDLPCPDEDGTIAYGTAEMPPEAIDLALDAALERIDFHMKPMADQKTNFLKIRNS